MTDYLDRIVARGCVDGPRVTPRLPSVFEPAPGADPVELPVLARQDPADGGPRPAVVTGRGEQGPADWSTRARATRSVEHDPHSGPGATGDRDTLAPSAAERPVQRHRSIQQRPGTAVETVLEPRSSVLLVRGAPAASPPAPGPSAELGAGHDDSQESTPQAQSPRSAIGSPDLRHQFITPALTMTHAAEPLSPEAIVQPPRTAAVQPTIKITIGRIDVRAVTSTVAVPRSSSERRPQLSLDDYLKRRSGDRP